MSSKLPHDFCRLATRLDGLVNEVGKSSITVRPMDDMMQA